FEFDATEPILDLVSGGEGFAITTPLCLWQSRHFLPKLRLISLPESPLGTRCFYLLSRRGELVNLVQDIAMVTKTLVLKETLASLQQVLEDLPDQAISIDAFKRI